MKFSNEEKRIIADTVYHAIAGLGLGTKEGRSLEYRSELDKYRVDYEINKKILLLYIKSVEVLSTEIETITGIDEAQTKKIEREVENILTDIHNI